MTLRCPECRTRRATYTSLTAHITRTGHDFCRCGGYLYTHRPGSPCCDSNPDAAVHRVIREGDTEARILLPGMRSEHPPF